LKIKSILIDDPTLSINNETEPFGMDLSKYTVKDLELIYDNLCIERENGNSKHLANLVLGFMADVMFEDKYPIGEEMRNDVDVRNMISKLVKPVVSHVPSLVKGTSKLIYYFKSWLQIKKNAIRTADVDNG